MVLLALSCSEPAFAHHTWGGIDLCAVYKAVLPPRMKRAQLPEANAPGARLVEHYCGQCHNFPGPGMHTAKEWPQVTERMQQLMAVTSRFGGLMGRVREPSVRELDILRDYLVRNALQPMADQPNGLGAGAFQSQCAGCHALPSPNQHNAAAWSAVVARMQDHMRAMDRRPATQETLVQVTGFLQSRSGVEWNSIAAPTTVTSAVATPIMKASQLGGLKKREAWLALGPFFGLTVLGVARWSSAHRTDRKADATRSMPC